MKMTTTLTAPAKIGGKFLKAGATVLVTEAEFEQLKLSDALPAQLKFSGDTDSDTGTGEGSTSSDDDQPLLVSKKSAKATAAAETAPDTTPTGE